MCGRFELNISKEKMVEKFGIEHWRLDSYKPRYNLAPSSNIPIIKQLDKKRIITYANWGLIPPWAKDKNISYKTFNARSETLAEKPSFRNAYKSRRCLIPASAYYEWQKLDRNNKQPFWIGRKDKEPFSMAGLFENWTNPETGELIESCTIITQNAYPELSSIHTRMPIILPNEYTQYWLNAKQDDFPSIEMSAINFCPISQEVGSPKNDYEFTSIN